MKVIKYIVFNLLLLCAFGLASSASGQEIVVDENGFSKMSFKAEINKSEYLPLEPIAVKFKFTNPTDQWIKTYDPGFVAQTSLKVIRKDKSVEFSSLFGVSIRIVQFPRSYKPGEVVEQNFILQPNYEYFTEPGSYKIQFVLYSFDGKEKLTASTFKINVRQPSGIDNDAYDFLKKNRNESSSFLFSLGDAKGENALILQEDFAARFSSSVYGEYAILNLANRYDLSGQFDRVKVELERIKNTENKNLAAIVREALIRNENKIKETR